MLWATLGTLGPPLGGNWVALGVRLAFLLALAAYFRFGWLLLLLLLPALAVYFCFCLLLLLTSASACSCCFCFCLLLLLLPLLVLVASALLAVAAGFCFCLLSLLLFLLALYLHIREPLVGAYEASLQFVINGALSPRVVCYRWQRVYQLLPRVDHLCEADVFCCFGFLFPCGEHAGQSMTAVGRLTTVIAIVANLKLRKRLLLPPSRAGSADEAVSEGGAVYGLLAKLDAFVEAHGRGGYAVGAEMTIASILTFVTLGRAVGGVFFGVPPTVCDPFPHIQAVRRTVGRDPAVVAWYDARVAQRTLPSLSPAEQVLVGCRDL
mgnify:CR=1 FL=1